MVLIRLTSDPSKKSHDFTTRFNNLQLDYTHQIAYEVALINASIYYNYYNVSARLKNNLFHYNNGTLDRTITIPDGLYKMTELISKIGELITTQGDTSSNINISTSTITGKTTISLLNNYTVTFQGTELHVIFGFLQNTILNTNGSHISPLHADITNRVSNISINSSLTSESYENGVNSNVIYTFSPSAEVGSLINISPYQPVYVKTNLHGGDHLRSIRISIEDGLNRPIDLNNESVSVLLDLRPISPQFNLANHMMNYFLKSSNN